MMGRNGCGGGFLLSYSGGKCNYGWTAAWRSRCGCLKVCGAACLQAKGVVNTPGNLQEESSPSAFWPNGKHFKSASGLNYWNVDEDVFIKVGTKHAHITISFCSISLLFIVIVFTKSNFDLHNFKSDICCPSTSPTLMTPPPQARQQASTCTDFAILTGLQDQNATATLETALREEKYSQMPPFCLTCPLCCCVTHLCVLRLTSLRRSVWIWRGILQQCELSERAIPASVLLPLSHTDTHTFAIFSHTLRETRKYHLLPLSCSVQCYIEAVRPECLL